MTDMSSSSSGRTTTSAQEIFTTIRDHPDGAVKMEEICESIGCSEPTVRKYLPELLEDGAVKSKYFGSGKGYWVPDDVDSL